MDGRCDVAAGMLRARALLLQLADMGMPAATETLDPVSPQYLSDLISWTAIGARTTESQTHREMASGLSMPVGFKNGTDGGLTVALNAMQASRAPHSFIGIDEAGQVGVVRTAGNHATHVVLRGGSGGPNYCETDVRAAAERLGAAGLSPRVLIDCSHANSSKRHENQPRVLDDVAQQLERGGQVYFVHNRVESIYSMAHLLQRLVPEARYVVGHGQMGEHELEKVMVDFVARAHDVLVATTIVENGLDIPNANTIVINRADRYGLAQLYQLRGRVGRSDRRAYAYLLVPPGDALSAVARKRLAAIREFSDLGSGFRVAALDLEIRGAGNLLGGGAKFVDRRRHAIGAAGLLVGIGHG